MSELLPAAMMILAVALIALNLDGLRRARTERVPRWSYALSVFTIVFMTIFLAFLLLRAYASST